MKKWLEQLAEDCKDILTESEFTARWTVIEGWHEVGKRIVLENENMKRDKIYGQKVIASVAKSIGKSERSLNYAVKFVSCFPSLDQLPEGKNAQWGQVIKKYLTAPKEEEKECQHEWESVDKCKKCRIKK